MTHASTQTHTRVAYVGNSRRSRVITAVVSAAGAVVATVTVTVTVNDSVTVTIARGRRFTPRLWRVCTITVLGHTLVLAPGAAVAPLATLSALAALTTTHARGTA